MVFRYSDGMWEGDLGRMYNLLSVQLDEIYSSPIDGLPEQVRTKVSPRCFYGRQNLGFTNRWEVLHVPIMTVDFKLRPEFCRRDTQRRNRLGQEVVESLVSTHR